MPTVLRNSLLKSIVKWMQGEERMDQQKGKDKIENRRMGAMEQAIGELER